MIGIEYILNLYEVTQQEIANELDIRKQNVNRWCKGERKIPEKYLGVLKEKFNLQKEYFNMELKKSDESKISLIKLKNENKPKIIKKTIETEELGKYEYIEEVYDKEIEEKIVLLEIEIKKEELLEEIKIIIDLNLDIFKNNITEYSEESRKIQGVFYYILDILKSKKIELDVLMEILNAVVLAYEIEEGFDGRPLVMHLMAVLKFYKFDEKLKYSIPKANIQKKQ